MINEEKAAEFLWGGRVDAAEGPRARRWHQQVETIPPKLVKPRQLALLGFAVDAGVARNQGRVGAAKGSHALRAALANMAWHHGETPVYDAGDVHCQDDELEAAQARFGERLSQLFAQGFRPIGLGGGHEIAYASWLGLSAHLQTSKAPPRIGILNLDAHYDLRQADRASSGTPFRQIADDCARRAWPFRYACFGVSAAANTGALLDSAVQLGVCTLWDWQMQSESAHSSAMLAQFLAGIDQLYLSVCMDVFPAAQAPGVSAPAALGVPAHILWPLLQQIRASNKLFYLDIAELNPRFDIDQRTAKLAARIVWELTCVVPK